jgi:hypothetical protein
MNAQSEVAMRSLVSRLLLSCSFVITIVSSAAGQRGQISVLQGTVYDPTGAPLPGATVMVSSPQLIGGPHTTENDEFGRYRFTALAPGTYGLSATRDGFQPLRRTGVELPPGLGIVVDLELALGGVDTGLEVVGSTPAVDVRSSASPHLIERQLLETLPVLSRTIGDYLQLAPGVTAGVAFGGAAGTYAVRMDGTTGNDPVQGRSDAQPSVYWLEALQVVSLGASAEHGEYTSALLNAITRSGANRYAGLGEYWWTRPTWAKWVDLLEWWDASAQLGGPVLRDRVWFFAGGEYFRNAWRPGGYSTGPRTPEEPKAVQTERKALVKLTTAPTRAMRIEGFLEREELDSRNGNASPLVRPEARAMFAARRDFHNVRVTWSLSDRTLLEASYGSFFGRNANGPADSAGRAGPPPRRDEATGVMSVNTPSFAESTRHVWAARSSVTRELRRTSFGSHELKAGVELERSSVRDAAGYPGGALFLDRDGVPDVVWFWNGWLYRPAHSRTSLYAQDIWHFGRFTLEPGIRVGFYDSMLPDTTARLYENHSISPRIGLAWDITANHASVVRAHYGHYHDSMATRFYEAFDPAGDTPTFVARVRGPNDFELVTIRPAVDAANTRIDPNVKHSYAEEWFAGAEHELWPRVSLKAQYIRRNTRNAIGYVDIGSTWTPVAAVDPGPDGRAGTTDDREPLTIFLNHRPEDASFVMTNPDGAWRRYDAVQFIGTRRGADGWALQASYKWAHTRGSFDNDHGSNASNTDMAANGNFANPNRAINSVGRTVHDRRHDTKLLGTYTIPYWGGVRISGIARFVSGAPWARLVNSFDPRTGAVIVVEPVGTRELPAVKELDVRVEKTFTPRGRVVATAYADVFNAADRVVPLRVNQTSGSAFERVTTWSQPRRFRLGVRIRF